MWELLSRLLRWVFDLDGPRPEQMNNKVVVNVNLPPPLPVVGATHEHRALRDSEPTNSPPLPTTETISEIERQLRAQPRIAGLLRHKRDRGAAEAAILYFCRGVDNFVERENPTKTWKLVEQSYWQLR